ncbi:molybdopterin-dependent oxidoreductase [Bradyrhizobium sp. SZCCHNRI1003]|uniref:molybdopterin-dependent oxidoreductase n=1 Tax=Bradyrhizobium sp. SZCCHNRI1003 TaxID=3057275 RepID=UPI002915C6ED|nr:molybdopterin-dependent oxidoreductase [Bradyrhizobium sp. SZCCHNRI1003]
MAGVGFAAGAVALGGLSRCRELLRVGDNLTYSALHSLSGTMKLAREYDRRDISPIVAIGTTDPANFARVVAYDETNGPIYDRLRRNDFVNWRLRIEGAVERSLDLSLDDLARLPARTQITKHTCEEGWTAIAEWRGVPLANVLELAGIKPGARYIHFYPFDLWADSIDMLDAFHPQTILAYMMNGERLPIRHGAPVRLRVETQLGYKNVKFLRRIVVTESFDPHFETLPAKNGWAWYAGI